MRTAAALLSAFFSLALLSPASGCGGSSTGNDGDGSGGSSSVPLGTCDNPITVGESGWVSCDEGFSHRVTAGTCDPFVPRSEEINGCHDSDCASLPYGHCWSMYEGLFTNTLCIAGCLSDDDCEPNEICLCEEPAGRCIPSDCSVDGDCGDNAFCSTHVAPNVPACGFYVGGAACQRTKDACVGDECNCAPVNGARACVPGLGGCGGG
jgi:hypothetical protein